MTAGGGGFQRTFTDKCCTLRTTYASMYDERDGKMPLAYVHVVQVPRSSPTPPNAPPRSFSLLPLFVPTPSPLLPAPPLLTLNPTHPTLDPTPYTLNPQPSTLTTETPTRRRRIFDIIGRRRETCRSCLPPSTLKPLPLSLQT